MTNNAQILNCINVPNYAADREVSVSHLGSAQINGISWQIYKVLGVKWQVRCIQSNFNNVCEEYEGRLFGGNNRINR